MDDHPADGGFHHHRLRQRLRLRDFGRAGALARARLPLHARVQHDHAQRGEGNPQEAPAGDDAPRRRVHDQRPVDVRRTPAGHCHRVAGVPSRAVCRVRRQYRQHLRHWRLAGRQERHRFLRRGHLLPAVQTVRRGRAERAGFRHVPLERSRARHGSDRHRGASRRQRRGRAAHPRFLGRVQARRPVRALGRHSRALRSRHAEGDCRAARRRVRQRGLHRRHGRPAENQRPHRGARRRDAGGLRRLRPADRPRRAELHDDIQQGTHLLSARLPSHAGRPRQRGLFRADKRLRAAGDDNQLRLPRVGGFAD